MRFLFAVCLLLAHVPLQAAGPAKPNIIVVMADDIGLGDLGFYHRERTGRDPVALFALEDNLYCAAFARNRLYRVSPGGEITVLAEYSDNDGANRELDQPADVMVYEGKVVISNFDLMGGPGMVNTGHDKPFTLSSYELESKQAQ